MITMNKSRFFQAGREVELTHTEYELLRLLFDAGGAPVARDTILDSIWGDEFPEPRVIDVHVRNLRIKVEVDPQHPEVIVTVSGVGYRLAS